MKLNIQTKSDDYLEKNKYITSEAPNTSMQ